MKLHILAALLLPVLLATGSQGAPRPNIILIMADDLGYETIGANGGTSYKTPVLDRLAATGARFEHCYAQPLCTPTRVQLMTGLYNIRNYTEFARMDPKVVTFANIFKEAGYATCIAGKWQLGQEPDLPKKFGFDEHCLWQHTRRPPRYANPGLEINGEEKNYTRGEYGPDIVNSYALDFIARHQGKPFFLYYPMILTHAPYQPTPDSPTWDPNAIGENVNRNEKQFGQMVEYMDKLIGKLVARLDELGLRDNTLLVFLGDNGTGRGTRSMMGQRMVIGGKGLTTAAGMHVPLIVNWPGKIASGTVRSDLVDSTDFLPTLCEASGIRLPADIKIDGRSFLPQLENEPGNPRQWIYSWYSPRREAPREFVFDRHFKLYRTGEFYDLRTDREEKHPLPIGSLRSEAAAAVKLFQAALEQYKGARPAHLTGAAPASPQPRRAGRNRQ